MGNRDFVITELDKRIVLWDTQLTNLKKTYEKMQSDYIRSPRSTFLGLISQVEEPFDGFSDYMGMLDENVGVALGTINNGIKKLEDAIEKAEVVLDNIE